MAKDSFNGVKKFWRTDWFAGFAVVVVVVAVHLSIDFFGSLERRFYDFASTSSSRAPSDRVAVIAIDDQSIANIGRWPWPRDVHAKLIDQLSAAKAKTIVHTAFFFEPQVDRGLSFIRKMKDVLATPASNATVEFLAGQQATSQQFFKVIAEAEQALDTDAILAASIRRAGNVLLPSVFVLGEPQGKADNPLPAFAMKSALDETKGFSVPAVKSQQPLEALGKVAAGVGHLNRLQDIDGAVRNEPLLVNYFGKAIPSMALLASVNSLNLNVADIKLNARDSVQIGKLRIKTDEGAAMLPQFYKGRDIKPANIMYELFSDTVKVTDFGIARITDSSKTKTGMVLGTPSFMSPEQLAGKKVDGRSDLYPLGVMLFQLLAGVLPFRGESMAELMYKIANEDAPDIRLIRRDLPESLADLVALSLSKRPETRYQNGDQFAADLRAVIVAMSTDSSDRGDVRPFEASLRPSVASDLSGAKSSPAHYQATQVHFRSGSSGFEKTEMYKSSTPAVSTSSPTLARPVPPSAPMLRPSMSGVTPDIEI